MSIIHQAPFIPVDPDILPVIPNADGFLQIRGGTYLAQRVFQIGFQVNIQVIFTLDGQLRILPSHTDPSYTPSDEWYEPGFSPDVGVGYEVRLLSTGQPFFVEAAPVGVWIDLEGDVLEQRRWSFARITQGFSQTLAVFQVRTLITHEDWVESTLSLTVDFS